VTRIRDSLQIRGIGGLSQLKEGARKSAADAADGEAVGTLTQPRAPKAPGPRGRANAWLVGSAQP